MLLLKKITTFFLFVFLLSSLAVHGAPPHHAVTFKPETGKHSLGHNIYTYSIAKWLSFKYEAPFFPVPFDYSNLFSIEVYEKFLDDAEKKNYACIVEVKTEDELLKGLKNTIKPTLFVVDYATTIHYKSSLATNFYRPKKYENIYLYAQHFKRFGLALRNALILKHQVCSFDLPKNEITVALHVKKGFNSSLTSVQYKDELSNTVKKEHFSHGIDCYLPLTFLPEQFYFDQLVKLSRFFKHAPLFVWVFTDDQNPKDIVENLIKRVSLPNITFSCVRRDVKEGKEDDFMIEDLYNMSRFDCLIKAESAFPLAAQLMGKHKVIIYPQEAQKYEKKVLNQFFIDVKNASIIFNDLDAMQTRHEYL